MAKIAGTFTIPDDHVALIGRITQAWAYLEFEIDRGIWQLAATHQQLAACITSQFISIHPRLDAFIALAQVRGSTKVAALKSFKGDISDLVNQRNRTTHDPRFKQKGTDDILRLQITGRPVHFGFVSEAKDDLAATLKKISDKVREFIPLRDSVIAEIEKLPPESQPTLREIMPVR